MNYSDKYTIVKQRWGTFVSYDLEGKELITSLNEEQCQSATEWYLYWLEHGFPEPETTHESYVGGKL